MVLQNYVILQPGVPARIHFSDHEVRVKTITDPLTGREKKLNVLIFTVDELNAREVVSYYSITSQKHAADFTPFLGANRYRDYDFVITLSGSGDRREYQVQTIARAVM